MKFSKERLPIGFLVFTVLLCALCFTSELVNDRFWLNDFKVYYLSAKAMLSGQQIYGIPQGLSSGFYKYSPFVLFLFIPLTFLPYKIASIIYYFGIVFWLLWIFSILKSFLNTYIFSNTVKNQVWILAAILVFIFNHLFRELHLGNTNILLILLTLLTLKFAIENQLFIAGILFCLILLFKPFFLILIIPLFIHKKFKLVYGAAVFMLFQSVLSIIILGWKTFCFLHLEWIKAMLNHSASFPSGNNIEYLVKYYFTSSLPSGFTNFVLIITILIFSVLFAYRNFYTGRKNNILSGNKNLLFECFLFIAIIPSILSTDTEHFLYSLPLISIIAFDVFTRKKPVLYIMFLVLFLFYGINSNDIVGKIIGDFLSQIGALGISNLFLVIWGFCLYFTKKKTPSTRAKGV